MRLVAVNALEGAKLEVQGVLADPGLAAVAGAQAVLTRKLELFMGEVAIMALEFRHYPAGLEIFMAFAAFAGFLHGLGAVREGVAVKAVKACSAHAVHQLVLMA